MEELLDVGGFSPSVDEVCHCQSVSLWEEVLHELFDPLIGDLVGDAEDLVGGADAAVDHELEF